METEALDAFALDMHAKLAANRYKSSWRLIPISQLLEMLDAEVRELRVALVDGGQGAIMEAADVANFAMMIADRVRHR